MSIQEARERQSQANYKIPELPLQLSDKNDKDGFHTETEAYHRNSERLGELSLAILEKSGARKLLDELQQELFSANLEQLVYLIVREEQRVHGFDEGTVTISLDWYPEGLHTFELQRSRNNHRFQSIKATAFALTEEVLIRGRAGILIPKAVWGDPDSKLVEDVILKAFQDPMMDHEVSDGFIDVDLL